jgi:hypothetical protein
VHLDIRIPLLGRPGNTSLMPSPRAGTPVVPHLGRPWRHRLEVEDRAGAVVRPRALRFGFLEHLGRLSGPQEIPAEKRSRIRSLARETRANNFASKHKSLRYLPLAAGQRLGLLSVAVATVHIKLRTRTVPHCGQGTKPSGRLPAKTSRCTKNQPTPRATLRRF